MVSSCPLPVRASLRDLLTDLLRRPVSVVEGEPQTLREGRTAVAAIYRRDDGFVAAAAVCDLTLAAHAGAAIGMQPASSAATAVDAGGDLGGDLLDFFREVVNVTARLLNGPSTPHVALAEVAALPGRARHDAADVILGPRARVDYRVAIDAYGAGTITLLGA